MTSVLSIITDALREGNAIPINSTPSIYEQAEAIRLFNTRVRVSLGTDIGEKLADWLAPLPQRTAPLAADYPQLPYPQNGDFFALSTPFATGVTTNNVYPYPPKNSRIVFGGVTLTVYFPEQPDDGSRMSIVQGSGAGDSGQSGQTLTLDGNGRTIEGSNTKTYADPITAREWLYRADLGDWVAMRPLDPAGACPFPSDLDDYWICGLAIRLARRFGKEVYPETVATFKEARTMVQTRYRQTANTVYGSNQVPRTGQSYLTGGVWTP